LNGINLNNLFKEAIVESQQQHPVELPNEVTKMLGSLKVSLNFIKMF